MSRKVINLNVGILGHVDSGKTAVAKALSTTASTAAFDKHPQSKERGITLDLGFSSFVIPVDEELVSKNADFSLYDEIQVTLVDCPGHASLIRTVIGGAQIIDLVLLVVDATKGMQTQTAECLLLAEITCPEQMIVVINKIDLIPPPETTPALEKMEKRLRKTLQPTLFASSPFVPISACPGANIHSPPQNIHSLISAFRSQIFIPRRTGEGKLTFLVDHCFAIKGQGTVMTGTVLTGKVSVGDTVEVPSSRESKKVKSIQVFRQPVSQVSQGDRCGICVTQMEASHFERGLLCSPGAVENVFAAVASLNRIPYFKPSLVSKSRFHISIGHETVMSKCSFFQSLVQGAEFRLDQEYHFLDQLAESSPGNTDSDSSQKSLPESGSIFALLEFDHAVLCPRNCLYIASRLDTDIHSNKCRLGFHGRLLTAFTDKNYLERSLPSLRVFKEKQRSGVVERMADEYTVIVHSLFKKETSVEIFTGLRVQLSTGEVGIIEGGFGQSGKAKIRFASGFKDETLERLRGMGRRKGKGKAEAKPAEGCQLEPLKVCLKYKKYLYDQKKSIIQ